jgi:hypothetical protein
MFRLWPISAEAALIVMGGTLQVAGVLTIVFEVLSTRGRLLDYLHRGKTALPGTKRLGFTFPTPEVVAEPPSIETRVQRLEEGLASLRGTVEELPAKVTSDMRREIAEASERTTAYIQQDLRPLADFIVDDVKANRAVRILGVVLIVAGIASSTAGGALAL